jgi:hypothetical protein
MSFCNEEDYEMYPKNIQEYVTLNPDTNVLKICGNENIYGLCEYLKYYYSYLDNINITVNSWFISDDTVEPIIEFYNMSSRELKIRIFVNDVKIINQYCYFNFSISSVKTFIVNTKKRYVFGSCETKYNCYFTNEHFLFDYEVTKYEHFECDKVNFHNHINVLL